MNDTELIKKLHRLSKELAFTCSLVENGRMDSLKSAMKCINLSSNELIATFAAAYYGQDCTAVLAVKPGPADACQSDADSCPIEDAHKSLLLWLCDKYLRYGSKAYIDMTMSFPILEQVVTDSIPNATKRLKQVLCKMEKSNKEDILICAGNNEMENLCAKAQSRIDDRTLWNDIMRLISPPILDYILLDSAIFKDIFPEHIRSVLLDNSYIIPADLNGIPLKKVISMFSSPADSMTLLNYIAENHITIQ